VKKKKKKLITIPTRTKWAAPQRGGKRPKEVAKDEIAQREQRNSGRSSRKISASVGRSAGTCAQHRRMRFVSVAGGRGRRCRRPSGRSPRSRACNGGLRAIVAVGLSRATRNRPAAAHVAPAEEKEDVEGDDTGDGDDRYGHIRAARRSAGL